MITRTTAKAVLRRLHMKKIKLIKDHKNYC